MRCPKCHYISFEAGDRCRNCGYEFSLSVDAKTVDLPIQTGDEPLGPLSDFSLSDLDRPQPSTAPAQPPAPKPQAATGLDLPLFKDRTPDDDRPLVTAAAVPRAPLAVRKSTPGLPRAAHRARLEEPEFDLESAEPDDSAKLDEPSPKATAEEPSTATVAPLGRRAVALMIDAGLLGLVDLAVLYFTLQLCGLQFFEIGILPPVPFLSFLLLQNGAYFVSFVALGGQTIGKMVVNIKVVPATAVDAWSDRVPAGAAVLRAAIWILTVLPAGIGLLPAIFTADHRAVHDRLAGTRVVKA
jgi:uncharacterized RDD family membrane protein YckC